MYLFVNEVLYLGCVYPDNVITFVVVNEVRYYRVSDSLQAPS